MKLYDETVRDLLGGLVGRTIVGITQHDREEFDNGERMHVDLLLDDGAILSVWDGADMSLTYPDGARCTIGLPDDDDEEDVEA